MGPNLEMLETFAGCTERDEKLLALYTLLSQHQLWTHPPVQHTLEMHPIITTDLIFLPSNKLLHTQDFFFSSPGFPNEHCEAYINKEMKHGSSRLQRKYHNHTNNINSLEKTLGAVNTLRWVVKGLGCIPVLSNRQPIGLLTKLAGRLHFLEAVQKWYWIHRSNNMEKPKLGQIHVVIKNLKLKSSLSRGELNRLSPQSSGLKIYPSTSLLLPTHVAGACKKVKLASIETSQPTLPSFQNKYAVTQWLQRAEGCPPSHTDISADWELDLDLHSGPHSPFGHRF